MWWIYVSWVDEDIVGLNLEGYSLEEGLSNDDMRYGYYGKACLLACDST